MTDQALAALARAAGIAVRWQGAFGDPQTVSADTLRTLLGALDLPAASPAQIRESHAKLREQNAGRALPALATAQADAPAMLPTGIEGPSRYRLELEDGGQIEGTATAANGRLSLPPVEAAGYHRLVLGDSVCTLAVAPPRCFGIADALGHERAWGLAAQLYGLLRAGDGGVGDFTSLGMLARAAAAQGADALAVSPVHALFAGDPNRYSPYAPSNRLLLNVLHADFGASGDMSENCSPPLIDWTAASAAKLARARIAFERLRNDSAFLAFRTARGPVLERHARFEVLHIAHGASDWRQWPKDLQDPDSTAVETFAQGHAHEVAFHAFLQWRADHDLAAAQAAAKDAGMGIGLIADLAIGIDPAGSYAWGHRSNLLAGVSVGAPPDLFNPLGQDWGLATYSPQALHRQGFFPFIELLRVVMRHAGGIRIDHILGLNRLWLVPHGATARDGAYLNYPLVDLLRLAALESWQHRCVVIGEDLGTVPRGLRPKLRAAGVLGTRVLWFERTGDGFTPPRRWEPAAVATSSTHDLPTVAGWWAGRDIEWREQLGLLGADETAADVRAGRATDRAALWSVLQDAGCAQDDVPPPDEPDDVLDGAARFIGRTRCMLALLPLEDLLGLREQPNLPGTTEGHPNWRRRLPVGVEHLMNDAGVRTRIAALREARRTA